MMHKLHPLTQIIALCLFSQTPLSFAAEEKEKAVNTVSKVALPVETKKIIKDVPIIPISRFVSKYNISAMKISPDGKSVVYTYHKKGINYLFVGDLVDDGVTLKSVLLKSSKGHATDPRWVTNDRIVFTMRFKSKLRGTKHKFQASLLYAIDRDGTNSIELRTDGTKAGKKMRQYDSADLINILKAEPKYILVGKSRNRDWLQDYRKGVISDVHKLNIHTGEMEIYMRAPKIKGVKLNDWYADRDGHIRFGYGNDRKGNSVMLIRGKNELDWQKLSENELFEEGKFSPLQFGSKENEFYVLSAMATGRKAVFGFDIATGELNGKIFAHDHVDVSSIIYSHKKKKVLAAVYYDEKREMVFFDKAYKRMRDSIKKALKMEVYIHSQSEDEKNIILLARDDTHPGSFFHYDVENKKIHYLGGQKNGIFRKEIARAKPMTYETRDGLTLSGYITAPLGFSDKPLPMIMLPHSNVNSRNYKDWDYTAKYLANRGYVVMQPNYRGSSGFGSDFQALGSGEWGRDMQNDLADAAHWAIKAGYADPDKICIMGKSYAGYAALMGIATQGDLFKCAISWGGVSDIKRMLKDDRSYDEDDGYYQRVAGDLEKKELKKISPIKFVKKIKGAVLLVHGEDDRYHHVKQSRYFAEELEDEGKSVDYYELEEVSHYLNTPELKQSFLEMVENFLVEFNPTERLLKLKKEGKIAQKPKLKISNR